MALTKREYVEGQTIITAQNLNDIQDAILDLEDTTSALDPSSSTSYEIGVDNAGVYFKEKD